MSGARGYDAEEYVERIRECIAKGYFLSPAPAFRYWRMEEETQDKVRELLRKRGIWGGGRPTGWRAAA